MTPRGASHTAGGTIPETGLVDFSNEGDFYEYRVSAHRRSVGRSNRVSSSLRTNRAAVRPASLFSHADRTRSPRGETGPGGRLLRRSDGAGSGELSDFER